MEYDDVDAAYLEVAASQRVEIYRLEADAAEAAYQEMRRKESAAIAAYEAALDEIDGMDLSDQEYDEIMTRHMAPTGYTADEAYDLRDYEQSWME
jgi:hypothetical protein